MAIVRVDDLRTQVFNELSELIRMGALDPHARLTEVSVSEMLGVSRTPAREALAMLVQQGILQQNRRGLTLPRPSMRQLEELTAVRKQLEPYAMRLVATKLNAEERKALAAYIREEVEAHGQDDSFISAHARIRDRVLEATGNSILIATIRQFDHLVNLIRISTLKRQSWRDESIAAQLRKADFIEKGDPDEMERSSRQMMDATHRAFSEFLREAELIDGCDDVEVKRSAADRR